VYIFFPQRDGKFLKARELILARLGTDQSWVNTDYDMSSFCGSHLLFSLLVEGA